MSEKKINSKVSKGFGLPDDELANVNGGLFTPEYVNFNCKYCNAMRVRVVDKKNNIYHCDACNSDFKKTNK